MCSSDLRISKATRVSAICSNRRDQETRPVVPKERGLAVLLSVELAATALHIIQTDRQEKVLLPRNSEQWMR